MVIPFQENLMKEQGYNEILNCQIFFFSLNFRSKFYSHILALYYYLPPPITFFFFVYIKKSESIVKSLCNI